MGVEFLICFYCEEVFSDAEYYFTCDCGFSYCSYRCGDGKIHLPEGTESCRTCRLEYIPDFKLVKFLLSRFSLTREEAESLYRNSIEGMADTQKILT